MAKIKRSSNGSTITAPHKSQPENDGFITTLHPKGSHNNIQHDIEKRRKLIRPEINYWNAALNVLIPIIICFLISLLNVVCALILFGLYALIRLRSIIEFFIRIYQRYASEDIRISCVFVPSCSEYMILSMKKYGAIRGVIKGVKRLKRCRFPNGGEDYP